MIKRSNELDGVVRELGASLLKPVFSLILILILSQILIWLFPDTLQVLLAILSFVC